MKMKDLSTLNLMPAIVRGYTEDIPSTPNRIGNEISFGMRRNVISKREGLKLPFKNSLLSGKQYHYVLQKGEVMYEMTKDINEALGYNEKEVGGLRFIQLPNGNYTEFEVRAERSGMVPLNAIQAFRMHQDIYATLYTIEIKTTNRPKAQWGDLAPYNLMQLNTYLGFNRHKFGFLLKVDLGCVKEVEGILAHGGVLNSASKSLSFIWNKYFFLYTHEFDKNLFEYTIRRIREYFHYIRENTKLEEIKCPDFVFSCSNECRNYCPNPIEKVKMESNDVCIHCKRVIESGTTGITRNGKMYHYTDVKGHPFEGCLNACKNAWRVVKDG